MEENTYLELFEIQPTAIRLLVLRAMMQAGQSVSLADLEDRLDTVDRSSIFRTLTLFLSHHLIHSSHTTSFTASTTEQVHSNMPYAARRAHAK